MPKRRDEQAPYWQQLRVAERSIIEFALEHGKTIRGTATILGISPNYLGERVRELGIPAPEVRPGPKPGTKRPAKPQLRVVPSTAAPTADTLDEDEDDDADDLKDEDEAGNEEPDWVDDEDEDEDEAGDTDENDGKDLEDAHGN